MSECQKRPGGANISTTTYRKRDSKSSGIKRDDQVPAAHSKEAPLHHASAGLVVSGGIGVHVDRRSLGRLIVNWNVSVVLTERKAMKRQARLAQSVIDVRDKTRSLRSHGLDDDGR